MSGVIDDAGGDVGRSRLGREADPLGTDELGERAVRLGSLAGGLGHDPGRAAAPDRTRRREPGLDDRRLPARQVFDPSQPLEDLGGRTVDVDLAFDADHGAGAPAAALTVTRTIPGGTPAPASDPPCAVTTSRSRR